MSINKQIAFFQILPFNGGWLTAAVVTIPAATPPVAVIVNISLAALANGFGVAVD